MTVVTTSRADGSAMPLDALGQVGALTWASAWPGGCTTAAWTLDVPATFSHPAMLPGRLVRIYDGTLCVWQGLLAEPQRAAPWQMSAAGLQASVQDFTAITAVGATTVDPNVALAQAIVRGLPVQVPATLPTPTLANASSGDCAALLNSVTQATGQRWQVDPYGNLTMSADPTAPSFIYCMTDTFGRTLDGYATDFYAFYQDSATNPAVVKTVASGSNPASTATRTYGRIEKTVDLTSQGPMSAAQAQYHVTASAALLGQRLNVTGQLTVQPGQLLTMGGVPARLASLQAGVGVLLLGAASDTALGEVNYSSGVTVTLGAVSYDVATDTAQISPVNALRRDFAGFLARVASYV